MRGSGVRRNDLIIMLFADGQDRNQIGAQLGITPLAVATAIRDEKRRILPTGGTKLDLRRHLVSVGMLANE